MARLSFKPDSSFFRKIALGAVGTRAVQKELARFGHDAIELESGSGDTKLWKDVKRKRVRIPDLVCSRCGRRIESRAKTKAKLSMSHSPTDAERAWDYGMVDEDWIAFPVCVAEDEVQLTKGQLKSDVSYWRERNWVQWRLEGRVNFFTVSEFRATPPAGSSRKGVTEGSETAISWNATFSPREGVADAVGEGRVTVRRFSDYHRYTWRVGNDQEICLEEGESVHLNQLLASSVKPVARSALTCPGDIAAGHLARLLSSRERTQRFAGVKLASARRDLSARTEIASLAHDGEEDLYVRLAACGYLVSIAGESSDDLFGDFLGSHDDQTRLETVIALGAAGTADAVEILAVLLDDASLPFFLRSAAAWALSRTNEKKALQRLIGAFADIDLKIREEALQGVVALGTECAPALFDGLRSRIPEIAAGSAEALRQLDRLPPKLTQELFDECRSAEPPFWTVWLLGHLPREQMSAAIADLQDEAPEVHYAVSLLWCFRESWIASSWELQPGPFFPHEED